MFRALGVILIVWYLSTLFTASFISLDRAATATFDAVEAAALHAKETLR